MKNSYTHAINSVGVGVWIFAGKSSEGMKRSRRSCGGESMLGRGLESVCGLKLRNKRSKFARWKKKMYAPGRSGWDRAKVAAMNLYFWLTAEGVRMCGVSVENTFSVSFVKYRWWYKVVRDVLNKIYTEKGSEKSKMKQTSVTYLILFIYLVLFTRNVMSSSCFSRYLLLLWDNM